jgi:hypothetical protein
MIFDVYRDLLPSQVSGDLTFMMPTIIRVIAGHQGSSCKMRPDLELAQGLRISN